MAIYLAEWRFKSTVVRPRLWRPWIASTSYTRTSVATFVADHGAHDRIEYRTRRYVQVIERKRK